MDIFILKYLLFSLFRPTKKEKKFTLYIYVEGVQKFPVFFKPFFRCIRLVGFFV